MAGTQPRTQRRATRGESLLAVVLFLGLVLPFGAAGQEAEATLQGEFAVTIAEEDVPPELLGGPTLVGRWQIAFNTDGTYALGRQDVGTLASGRFDVDGDLVILTDETGLLACGLGGDAQAVTGVYRWAIVDERLRLAAVEDTCAGRRLLLTTRLLSPFVSCPAAPNGEPIAGADVPAPPATPAPAAGAQPSPSEIAAAIDDLLTRMSACWATLEPERFLALLSGRYRATLVDGSEGDLRRFALAMGVPIVWERSGEIEPVGAGRVVAIVRQTSGDHEDFVPYAFVFEDGAWRWDGTAESAAATRPAGATPVAATPDATPADPVAGNGHLF